MNGMNLWEVTTDVKVIPPIYKRPRGRPPGKKRKKGKGEPREVTKISKRETKIHCGICGQEVHKKLKCKNAPIPKAPKKPPGRPRKTPYANTPFASAPTTVLDSESQAHEDLPSLSSALPRKHPGRPRKQPDGASSSQLAP